MKRTQKEFDEFNDDYEDTAVRKTYSGKKIASEFVGIRLNKELHQVPWGGTAGWIMKVAARSH